MRVGHASGGRSRRLRRAAFAGYAMLLLSPGVSATIMVGGNHAIVGSCTPTMAVAALASAAAVRGGVPVPDGCRWCRLALRGLEGHARADVLAALAYWGIGMPWGDAGLRLGAPRRWGPRGMWVGLIAGLTVAAVLLAGAFLRSSAPDPHRPRLKAP